MCFIIQGITIQAQDNLATKFFNQCVSNLSEKYTSSVKKDIGVPLFKQDPLVKKFYTPNLSTVSYVIFTSKKVVAKNTRLRFKIVLYQYKSDGEAGSKFSELEGLKRKYDETLLGKDWDHVLIYRNLIIRLDAGCLYSKVEWIKLKEQLLKAHLNVFKVGVVDSSIECKCGGNCK